MILSLQVIGLFFGIWFTTVNFAHLFWARSITPINLVIMSAMWTLFIAVTWLI